MGVLGTEKAPIAKAGKTGTGRIPCLWESGPVSEIQRPHCPPAGIAPGRQTKDTRSGGYDIQKALKSYAKHLPVWCMAPEHFPASAAPENE